MKELPQGYTYAQNVKEDMLLWGSFNRLAAQVFGGLQFPAWLPGGLQMGPCYQPRAVCLGTQVVANVSANLMRLTLRGKPHTLVQLGTVMVHPQHRGKGLAAYLMQGVMREFSPQCEGMYLYANDDVLGFYPCYGFVQANELAFTLPLNGENEAALEMEPLNPGTAEGRGLLRQLYEIGNPYSALTVHNYPELMEFYCLGPDKNNVFYLPKQGGVAVLETQGGTLVCKEIYCLKKELSLPDLLKALAAAHSKITGKSYTEVQTGFTPLDAAGFTTLPLKEEDTTLFVLQDGFNPFQECDVRSPLLSHT